MKIFTKADSLRKSGNYKAYSRELYTISNQLKTTKEDKERILKLHLKLLEFYKVYEFDSDSVKKYHIRGINLSKEYQNWEYLTNFKYMWADYQIIKGDYTKALESFQSLQEIIEKNDYSFLPHFYDSYARLLYYLKEYDKAFELLRKEAKIFERRKENENIAGVYNNLGILYKYQKKIDSSLYYHQKSQKINLARHDTVNIIKSYNNIGQTYFNTNDLLNADKYYQLAYNYAPDKASKSLLTNYATLLLVKGDLKKAEQFLLDVIQKQHEKELIKTALTQMVVLKKKEKDFEQALFYMEKFNLISQELLDETKVREIKRLQIRYETAQKEQEIQSLLEKNKVQETIIQKNRWLVSITLVVLLLVITIFILYIRNKYNVNKIHSLQMQQRLLRSQINPHFIFNALSTIQTNILKHENKKAVKYLVKFSKLLRYTLENSNFNTAIFSEEIKVITDFLDMQKLRLDDKLDYEFHVDETIEQDFIRIPAMMLQPIIENAIEHGVESVEKPKVEIFIKDHQEYIQCTIQDNGVGYSHSIKNKNAHKKSFATTIIKERLHLLSKKTGLHLTYSIEDILGDKNAILGSQAVINLPVLVHKNKEL